MVTLSERLRQIWVRSAESFTDIKCHISDLKAQGSSFANIQAQLQQEEPGTPVLITQAIPTCLKRTITG
jgi:hypothetical protein